jgi:MoaA/NifB/PqqE/SkfB family radical SAM enzyme
MTWSTVLRNSFVWRGPTLHMIVTTLRCNHKCRYCHAAVAPMTATQFDMDEATAKKS